LYNLDAQKWLELAYMSSVLFVLCVTGYVFTQLLEYMDQKLLVIKGDRLFLLQQNMDLLKENKEIKMVLKKMMQNISEEDKKNISNY
jgi:UDP-2,3-diacylglucosamine pyrophosphatase LpxH